VLKSAHYVTVASLAVWFVVCDAKGHTDGALRVVDHIPMGTAVQDIRPGATLGRRAVAVAVS
jgi:hypothetical protein